VRFKGILLDLDGTLYDYDKAHAAALTAVVAKIAAQAKVSASLVKAAVDESRSECHRRLQGTAASHNRLLYFQGACERLGISPFPLAADADRIYWDIFLKNMVLRDGVDEFFKALAGVPIALVTDLTADVQHRKVTALGLSSRIKFLVTSEEAGQEKPAAPIFNLALEKLGLSPKDVCMIGDDFDKDVAGAAALGIFPVWFNPSGGGKTDEHCSFRNFYDIAGFLKDG
jgi:putative hydrolase of the HAD superfamily